MDVLDVSRGRNMLQAIIHITKPTTVPLITNNACFLPCLMTIELIRIIFGPGLMVENKQIDKMPKKNIKNHNYQPNLADLFVKVNLRPLMILGIISGAFNYTGNTEVDELYLSGKAENKHMSKRVKAKGVYNKAVIVGMVNRETKHATMKHVKSAEYHVLGKEIMNKIECGSTLITDGFASYETLKRYYQHETVNHSVGEYVKTKQINGKAYKIHTNTVEGLFGMIRRVVIGTYHFISVKHTQKYLNEIAHGYSS